MSNILYILRGVSGAGKSTLAVQLCELPNTIAFAADDYHYMVGEGVYDWKPFNMKKAHQWCRESVEGSMKHNFNIVIHNTNTCEKEIKPYLELAENYNYKVISLVVENRHGNNSIHNVPQEVRDNQEKRLRGNLKLQ